MLSQLRDPGTPPFVPSHQFWISPCSPNISPFILQFCPHCFLLPAEIPPFFPSLLKGPIASSLPEFLLLWSVMGPCVPFSSAFTTFMCLLLHLPQEFSRFMTTTQGQQPRPHGAPAGRVQRPALTSGHSLSLRKAHRVARIFEKWIGSDN